MAGTVKQLLRRMGTRCETVRKDGHGGVLGRKVLRVVLDGTLTKDEVLCLVRNDGEESVVLEAKAIEALCRERQGLGEGEMLFAVLRSPFNFPMSIEAGDDSRGFAWFFEIAGRLEIRKPESFARAFRGEAGISDRDFEQWLGTIPATKMHDKVVVDVLGVMSLEDKDEENQYVDMRKRLEQNKEVGEKVVTSAISAAFEDFFGERGVVSMDVSSFHARSPKREEEIERRKIMDERRRIEEEKQKAEEKLAEAMKAAEQADKAKQDLRRAQARSEAELRANLARLQAEQDRFQAEQKAAADKRRRDQEIAEKEHEVKLAELAAQKKKLEEGDVKAAFSAFEMLANMLDKMGEETGNGTFSLLLRNTRRAETGLRLLALAEDRKRRGEGVKLVKNYRTHSRRTIGGCQGRGMVPTTIKTSVLHQGETLSSTVVCERRGGYLTVLNVSETNEIVPLLPNGDFPGMQKMAHGERKVIADESCKDLTGLHENASSGTDHLVAFISDKPLLAQTLPPLGKALSATEAAGLVAKLADMDDCEWAADVLSFAILP